MKTCRYFLLAVLILKLSFVKSQFLAKATIDHVQLGGVDTCGNIYLNVAGGNSPYTYTWQPGTRTVKDYTNAVVGTYTVWVNDSLSSSISYTYQVGYKTQWINHYGTLFRNDSVLSNGQSVTGVRTTITKNTLPANTDGWFQYIVPDYSNTYVVGFLDSNSVVFQGDIYDIDFAMHLTNGNYLYAWSGGSWTYLTTVQAGDVCKVERSGSNYNLYLNNTLYHTYAAPANRKLKIKFATEGDPIANLGVSFTDTSSIDRLCSVVAAIDHIKPDGIDTIGGINISYKNGDAPINYLWTPGNSTNKDLTNASLGSYTFKIKDNNNDSIVKQYDIGYKTDWINHYGTLFRNDSLISDGVCCYSARTALTKNTLPANTNGWVEYVVSTFSAPYLIGFLDSAYTPSYGYDTDFSLHEYYGNNLYAWSSGYLTWLGTVQPGDVLKLERIDSMFYLKKNNSTLFTDVALINKKYKVKGYFEGGSLANIGVSFTDTSSIDRINSAVATISHVDANNGESLGNISISINGGTTPYAFKWYPDGQTTKDLLGVSVGDYTLVVKDALDDSIRCYYSIGYKTMWKEFYGTEYSNDSLKSNGESGFYNRTALTLNQIDAYTDGWLEYIAPATTTPYLIGFLDSSYTPDHIMDLDFALHGTEYNDLYAWASGNFIWLGSIRQGDVLRVERIGSDYTIRKNGVIMYTQATNNNTNIFGKGLLISSPLARVGSSTPLFVARYLNYAVLENKLNGGYYHIKNNTLYFKYNDQYNAGTLNYNLYDEKRNLISPCSNLIRNLGDNRFKLDLTQCGGSASNSGYYTLEVINEKNEKSYLKIYK